MKWGKKVPLGLLKWKEKGKQLMPLKVREQLEARERTFLSSFASLSRNSKGRVVQEEECDIRPAFQHDRDRIIHSKAFRRLKHKTQVFLAPTGDHYRTRLTHTVEVSQIARTISKSLRLNEDLTEAIALGHDLGHTPFGHAGEEVLDKLVPGGFHHAEQSLRVVDVLERDGMGLNLTFEVRDGILRHSKGKGEIICEDLSEMPITPEGQVVRIADIIAYINHDIDDALRGEIIRDEDIPKDCSRILGYTHSQRINTMVVDIIASTVEKSHFELCLSKEISRAMVTLRDFLYERVYDVDKVHGDFIKSSKIVGELYHYFIENEEDFLREIGKEALYDPLERCVCDFIAGMTDRYACKLYEKIFLPLPWVIF
jgi:dGTPase